MIIGLTGGIGSGKSTIASELAKRGFAVYDCDTEAKRLIAEDHDVQQAIIDLLGEEAFTDGRYNTAYVAQRVFAEPALLAQLNAIIHPAVQADIEARQPNIIESAILFESGLDALCDQIIVIEAPEEIRIQRTIARDYQGEATEENINKVRARICAQSHFQPTRDVLTILNDGHQSIAEIADEAFARLQK